MKKEEICSLCNERFVSKDILKIHNIVAHSKLVDHEIDFQNLIHSATSLIQKEVGTNSKQQQDASKVSIQETNTDLKTEEDSIISLIERDYSNLKKQEFSFRTLKKQTDSKLRKKENTCKNQKKEMHSDLTKKNNISKNRKKETNSKLKTELICSHCKKGFGTKDILTVHNIVAHSKLQIKLKRIDSLVAKYQPSVNRNLVSVHKRKKPWKCQLCPSSFPYQIQLKNHVKWVHDKTKTEKCSDCNATFARKGDLNKHYEKAHFDKGKSELNFGPNITLDKTIKTIELKSHVEKAHGRKKKYKCTICETAFTSKISLTTHIEAVHEGIKSHKCSFCDASFGQTGTLNRHIANIHGKKEQKHYRVSHSKDE